MARPVKIKDLPVTFYITRKICMYSIEEFKAEYEVEETEFSVQNKTLKLFVPVKIDRFINPDDLFKGFPLWSKIWEATAVLANRLALIKPDSEKRFLEIGAGMGVAGLFASTLGHQVTITEYNQDALNFAWANAMINGSKNPDIRELDWTAPTLEGQFDYIIGSEVVFKEEDFMCLFLLFQKYLKPGGKIILAEGMRKTSLKFVEQMNSHYRLALKKINIRSDKADVPVVLIEMSENN